MFVANQTNHVVEVEVARFPKPYRRRLRRLVTGSNALADLVVSFPAAAFALVSGYGSVADRGRAVALVKSGASLKAVADALGLPMWLRKLPPEAFSRTLPAIPQDAELNRRLPTLVPRDRAVTRSWLEAVLVNAALGEPEYAAWIAGKPEIYRSVHPMRGDAFRLLAAFAWYSAREDAAASQLVGRRWQKSQATSTVAKHASRFGLALIKATQRGTPKRGPGRYSTRNRCAGFAVVALRTPADLFEEGRMMDHCVGTYADAVARGECMIFGLRQSGHRVATMEVVAGNRPYDVPRIVQIQGPGNSNVEVALVRRAREWLLEHASNPVAAADQDQSLMLVDDAKWERLWAPYTAAKPAAANDPGALSPAVVKNAALLLHGAGYGGAAG